MYLNSIVVVLWVCGRGVGVFGGGGGGGVWVSLAEFPPQPLRITSPPRHIGLLLFFNGKINKAFFFSLA